MWYTPIKVPVEKGYRNQSALQQTKQDISSNPLQWIGFINKDNKRSSYTLYRDET